MNTATRRTFLTWQLSWLGASALAGSAAADSASADSASADSASADSATDYSATDYTSGPPSRQFLAAVAAGDITVAARLLAADPGLLYVRDPQGRSAFAIALLAARTGMAELLRENGYLPDVHEAALALDWDRFNALAEEAPGALGRHHAIGGTAMVAGAKGGAGSDIWRVYRWGAVPNPGVGLAASGQEAARQATVTPLSAALDFHHLPTAEMTAASLLANGADPRAPEPLKRSPLHIAAARGSLELVEMLIRKGALLDQVDEDGKTPEDRGREHGRTAVVSLLGRHREIPRDHSSSRQAYDVDGHPYREPDLSGFTLASRLRTVGVSHGNLDAVQGLVARHPALAHAVATTTERAVEAGAHTGNRAIVDHLLALGAPYALPTAVMRSDSTRVKSLLAEDPLRIHERGAHDFALLWYPIIGGGTLELAELLLAAGAEVERQHHLGTTALHWAARSGQLDMMALLLDHGADPRRVGRKFDARGQTPLEVAEKLGQSAAADLLRGVQRS